MRVSRIHSVTTDDGGVIRYVDIEFNTPSTHEVTIGLDDDDRPAWAEEIAYGGWYIYESDEVQGLLDYMSDHGIEFRDVLEEARKK